MTSRVECSRMAVPACEESSMVAIAVSSKKMVLEMRKEVVDEVSGSSRETLQDEVEEQCLTLCPHSPYSSHATGRSTSGLCSDPD